MAVKPTTGHTAVFRPGSVRAERDGRLYAGAFERNIKPVIDGLLPFLAGRSGAALEIGSGTGQHVVEFCHVFPRLRWTPSDPDQQHRRSIDAWRKFVGSNTNVALDIDAAADWAAAPIFQTHRLQVILCLNVIHIAPIAVATGIVAGAAKVLVPGGLLVFYGPFQQSGQHMGEGNAIFDRRLRQDNPDWGVRDLGDITDMGQALGLAPLDIVAMPANNRLLILQRTSA